MQKSIPKLIGVVDRPIIIVGEKPARQHLGKESPYSLEGNRTGEFVAEAISGYSNLILTNVVNVLYQGNFNHGGRYLQQGLFELSLLIKEHSPSKIICLGAISSHYVNHLNPVVPPDCEVISFPHPSWINRFRSKERSEYIHQLKKYIDDTYKRV